MRVATSEETASARISPLRLPSSTMRSGTTNDATRRRKASACGVQKSEARLWLVIDRHGPHAGLVQSAGWFERFPLFVVGVQGDVHTLRSVFKTVASVKGWTPTIPRRTQTHLSSHKCLLVSDSAQGGDSFSWNYICILDSKENRARSVRTWPHEQFHRIGGTDGASDLTLPN